MRIPQNTEIRPRYSFEEAELVIRSLKTLLEAVDGLPTEATTAYEKTVKAVISAKARLEVRHRMEELNRIASEFPGIPKDS